MKNPNSSNQGQEPVPEEVIDAAFDRNSESLRLVIRDVLKQNGLGLADEASAVDATTQLDEPSSAGDPIVDGLLKRFESRANSATTQTQNRPPAPEGKQRMRPQDLGRLR